MRTNTKLWFSFKGYMEDIGNKIAENDQYVFGNYTVSKDCYDIVFIDNEVYNTADAFEFAWKESKNDL